MRCMTISKVPLAEYANFVLAFLLAKCSDNFMVNINEVCR